MTRINVELSPRVIERLQEGSLGNHTLKEEAVRMLQYGLRQMFPPQTPDEWKHFVKRDDWKEAGQTILKVLMPAAKEAVKQKVPSDPLELELEVPSDMAFRIEELAQAKHMTMSEATGYTIEFALSEIFPPRSAEESKKELGEIWRQILRSIWKARE